MIYKHSRRSLTQLAPSAASSVDVSTSISSGKLPSTTPTDPKAQSCLGSAVVLQVQHGRHVIYVSRIVRNTDTRCWALATWAVMHLSRSRSDVTAVSHVSSGNRRASSCSLHMCA